MQNLKRITPLHLYIIPSVFIVLSYNFKNENQLLYYSFGGLGIGVLIWAFINYFKN